MISFLPSKKLIGYCLCKDIKVKIDRESLTDKSNEILLCHCSKCQRGGAGLASLDLMSLNGKVTLIDEKSLIAKYDDTDTKSNVIFVVNVVVLSIRKHRKVNQTLLLLN
ncbi:unnamed protein product [Adineta ricciae]|uniref:CENP-V/GFA domain-containing protein n=1 Tax=Adineta ricciae TaxID=249248 RepID=A0A814Q436_ADIRI|nr:unnamed protein product [Adineta ricciae]CAF1331309.1 unnamed protein product [Adineta ricciae]